MKTQLLIEELSPVEARIVTESSPDGKNAWLAGIFMQAGLKNQNGREYPLNEIAEAVKTATKIIESRNGIMGELDHPQTLTINLDRVSHVITELKMDGNNAFGKAKMLSTPMGNIAKELINSGVSLGVSSRGAGQVSESGGVSAFQFVTVDIVAQPSAPEAFPKAVYESLERYRGGHNILDLAEAARNDPRAQQFLKREIMKWLAEGLFARR